MGSALQQGRTSAVSHRPAEDEDGDEDSDQDSSAGSEGTGSDQAVEEDNNDDMMDNFNDIGHQEGQFVPPQTIRRRVLPND